MQVGLDEGFTRNVEELTQTLRLVAPHVTEPELQKLGRTIRRIALGTIFDASADLEEVMVEMRAVIDGYVRRAEPTYVSASA